uniref:Uncharacterized protein n=1 Tax=Oryza glumipatula TaxID=40148 RepID=A0A0E0B4S4_9ORYZ
MRDQRTTLQPVRQLMAVSNNRSNTSALLPAPSVAATHNDSNNIVTKVMSSLLWFQLGACTAGRVHIKDPSSEKCLIRLEPGHHLRSTLETKKDSPPLFPTVGRPIISQKVVQRQSVSLIKSATWLERLCLLKLHQFLYEVVISSPMTLEREVLPQPLQGYRISIRRAINVRESRDSSILQHRLQSMSQALDFNVVINISHASHATPTQMSGK